MCLFRKIFFWCYLFHVLIYLFLCDVYGKIGQIFWSYAEKIMIVARNFERNRNHSFTISYRIKLKIHRSMEEKEMVNSVFFLICGLRKKLFVLPIMWTGLPQFAFASISVATMVCNMVLESIAATRFACNWAFLWDTRKNELRKSSRKHANEVPQIII